MASKLKDAPNILRQLHRAAEISWELQSEAKDPSTDSEKFMAQRLAPYENPQYGTPIGAVPKISHVVSYENNRFWAQNYAPIVFGRLQGNNFREYSNFLPIHYLRTGLGGLYEQQLLTEENTHLLREYLTAENPDIRAMTVELLALLHNPENVPSIAALLHDTAEAPPFLGYNINVEGPRSSPRVISLTDTDPLIYSRSWRTQTVSDYARRALELMTGERFDDKAAFDQWWSVYSGGKDCLWYWQFRVNREMAAFDQFCLTKIPWTGEPAEQTQGREMAVQRAILDYNRQNIERELQQCSPEVEAKILLLTHNPETNFSDIKAPLWAEAPSLRLSSDRLFELLERKNLWKDVDWSDQTYSRMAERMGLWADTLFTPNDVPRLKAVMEKERGNLSETAAQTLEEGIQRLIDSKEE
ncbi:MAG: hypothetical protein JXR40_13140, partial [Pontiellaceae bacterium]|nr:hypothetical protein [Pontiellaceae bacterium]